MQVARCDAFIDTKTANSLIYSNLHLLNKFDLCNPKTLETNNMYTEFKIPFLVYPFSFKGKLIQYIGRVQRSEITPTIYDYRDIKITYLNKLFLKRNSYYRKIEKQLTLFDDQTFGEKNIDKALSIQKTIRVPIEDLDFRYGMFVFTYNVSEMDKEVEFEIENDEIRPEFEVLKPYFVRLMKSKSISVKICIELQKKEVVSQIVTSEDLNKINKDVIEGMKFSFLDKKFFIQKPLPKNTQSDSEAIQKLYNSEEELLNEILKFGKYLHSRPLMYLSQKHETGLFKLKFVLSPFSFVFFLSGNSQFHIVLETLNTKEATYIWHIPKNINSLESKLKGIDRDISLIRTKGRQVFLENSPKNFSRIIHDYSDERKGFILWKGLLEETLV